jgi:uncharacterized protein (DUF1778 family)
LPKIVRSPYDIETTSGEKSMAPSEQSNNLPERMVKSKKVRAGIKVKRLETRISKQEQDLFSKAAAIKGQSLSDFMVSSAHEAAARVIETHEIIRLAEHDKKLFVDMILNPPDPNEKLKSALDTYRKGLDA